MIKHKDENDIEFYLDSNGEKFYLNRQGISFEPCEFDKHELHDNEILTAKIFIKFMCKTLKRPNKDYSSYGFKHCAENWGEKFNDCMNKAIFSNYISNGAFILASKEMGLTINTIRNSYNCYINLSLKK